ncbi:MAG TPA: hypothetical protein VGN20_21810 [Mucilaginibacter sp.]
MKKLLFVVAASFFSCTVYAQVETLVIQSDGFGPKELKCTEEAISFRVNIRPNLQLYSFRPGYTDFANGSPGFIPSKKYSGEDIITEPVQLVKYENTFNRRYTQPIKNFLFPEKKTKYLMQTSQFANGRFFYNFYSSLQSSNFNFLVPSLN